MLPAPVQSPLKLLPAVVIAEKLVGLDSMAPWKVTFSWLEVGGVVSLVMVVVFIAELRPALSQATALKVVVLVIVKAEVYLVLPVPQEGAVSLCMQVGVPPSVR